MKVITYSTNLQQFEGEYSNMQHLKEALNFSVRDHSICVFQKSKSIFIDSEVILVSDYDAGEWQQDAGEWFFTLAKGYKNQYHLLGLY